MAPRAGVPELAGPSARDAATALAAARAGADALRPFLAARPAAEDKADGSPVTEADRAASAAILRALARLAPGDVVISEEETAPPGADTAARRWFVDPIDGTREFVAGLPEFCVMVGLVVDGAPAVGCVLMPTTGEAHLGVVGRGAWVEAADGATRPLRVASGVSLRGARELTSRFREPPELRVWAEGAGIGARAPCGSMGVKAARIARGEADLHLRPFGPCAVWDSAAPAALILAAGGEVGDGAGRPPAYDTLAHEGFVICASGLLAPLVASWSAFRAAEAP